MYLKIKKLGRKKNVKIFQIKNTKTIISKRDNYVRKKKKKKLKKLKEDTEKRNKLFM